MNLIRNGLGKFMEAKRFICSFILIVMLAITFVQVVLRYCFNSPFNWAEEVTLMLLVWFGFICMSLDIYTDSHVAIHFAYDKMPHFAQKICDILRHGLLTYFFYQMVYYGYKLTIQSIPKRQPASGLSQGFLFSPLLILGAVMFLYSILNLICIFIKDDKKEAGLDE